LVWGRIGEKVGVRRLATFGFFAGASCLFVAGYSGAEAALVSAGLLLLAAFFVVPLDAVGSVPFYRAVHPHERPEMTAVYRTYLDVGELIPPLAYGLLLGFFGFGAVFVALGGLMALCGAITWHYVPRRL